MFASKDSDFQTDTSQSVNFILRIYVYALNTPTRHYAGKADIAPAHNLQNSWLYNLDVCKLQNVHPVKIVTNT